MAKPPLKSRTAASPSASRTETSPAAAEALLLPALAQRRAAFEGLAESGQIKLTEDMVREIITERQLSVTKVYRTIEGFKTELIEPFLSRPPVAPARLQGSLANPDGTPAAQVAVEWNRPAGIATSWQALRAVTDAGGNFVLRLSKMRLPPLGLSLTVRGADGTQTVPLALADVMSGDLGLLVLQRRASPLPRSILADLSDIVADWPELAEVGVEPEQPNASADRPVVLGEGDCARIYAGEGGTLSRYQYGVFFRLVEPALSRPQLRRVAYAASAGETDRPAGRIVHSLRPDALNAFPLTVSSGQLMDILNRSGELGYADRIPVDAPIDVTDFHAGVASAPRAVPKAATLGLGYVVRMNNVAILDGYVRGNLVYSLPLAPGEEQRIMVVEREDRVSATEREAMTYEEEQAYDEAASSEMEDTFSSAFDETVNASSQMSSKSKSGSFGLGTALGAVGNIYGFNVLGGGGAAGGYGAGSTSGSSSSSQDTSRDFVSRAAQSFSSNLARKASMKRRASRVSIRTATSSSREMASSRIIANRNHSHALTMQWFEVLRRFTVTTQVEGIDLVCLVPLELVGFARPAQDEHLAQGNQTRANLLDRYAMLLRYIDALGRQFPARSLHARGLEALRAFAANPHASPASPQAPASEVVAVSLKANVMPFDRLRIQLVTKSGDVIGPVTLQGSVPDVPTADLFTKDQVLDELLKRRTAAGGVTLTAEVTLPRSVPRADIARIDILHGFSAAAFPLKWQSILETLEGTTLGNMLSVPKENLTASFTVRELETELGGPPVWTVSATLPDDVSYLKDALGDRSRAVVVTGRYAMAANTVAPILGYEDLLAIEATYQHIVRHTTHYSKIVWSSLSDEERAIMLEPFTIGVPEGGLTDDSQEIPLLSCVRNEVLGYFGNAMMMPFSIPPQLAKSMEITTADAQEALLRFHREAFSPARTTLTLPTRGVLGEAMLGSCNASEKIDITRFWNWQDSPIPGADAPVFTPRLPTDGAGAATAPSVLGSVGVPPASIAISNGAAPSPSGSLLAEVLKAAPDLAKAGADMTGLQALQQQLAAETASAAGGRDKAIDQAADLTKAAMTGAVQARAIDSGMNPFQAPKEEKKDEKGDAKPKDEAKEGGGGQGGGNNGGGNDGGG